MDQPIRDLRLEHSIDKQIREGILAPFVRALSKFILHVYMTQAYEY